MNNEKTTAQTVPPHPFSKSTAMPNPNITIPVDLTNPGQFFACCGLLELADRLWPGAQGWFENHYFNLAAFPSCSFSSILMAIKGMTISNTMTKIQVDRLKELSAMSKKQRENEKLEEEKKFLETLRREFPIILNGKTSLRIDWFCDDFAGGSRFKTWAGQQSVFDIAVAMHEGIGKAKIESVETFWQSIREIGLPFNFDSDLGSQGSALDIGFSFDPLADSQSTRIKSTCKPVLEFLCFVGLQRFRPFEIRGENRFVYTAWNIPVAISIASALSCASIRTNDCPAYEFRLLYRTKYLKSFLPAQPFQGDRHE